MGRKVFKTKISQEHTLPVIRCSCGAEILIVPDIREMSKAIEDHMLKHERFESHKKVSQIREGLIMELFDKVSQLEI